MFLETYGQAAANLAYIRQITRVTCQLVDFPFTVGRGVVVSGRFNQVGYVVVAFICYPDVCGCSSESELEPVCVSLCRISIFKHIT